MHAVVCDKNPLQVIAKLRCGIWKTNRIKEIIKNDYPIYVNMNNLIGIARFVY